MRHRAPHTVMMVPPLVRRGRSTIALAGISVVIMAVVTALPLPSWNPDGMAQALETGRKMLQSVQQAAASGQECYGSAMESMQANCWAIISQSQQQTVALRRQARFCPGQPPGGGANTCCAAQAALTLTLCHLAQAGRPTPPNCELDVACTSNLTDVAFAVYTEFFTHIGASCGPLQVASTATTDKIWSVHRLHLLLRPKHCMAACDRDVGHSAASRSAPHCAAAAAQLVGPRVIAVESTSIVESF